MGWGKKLFKRVAQAVNPVHVTGSLIKGGAGSLKQLSQGDLKGAINTAGIGWAQGSADPLMDGVGKSYKDALNKPLPTVNYNQQIRDQQNGLVNNQLNNADNFDVAKYVTGEAGAYRKRLAGQVNDAQNNYRGNENSRGMLFSGRRQKGEGDIDRAAQEDYGSYTNYLITDAMQRQQAMKTDPLAATANLQLANQRQSSNLQAIRDRQNQANAQIYNQASGMVGSGIGTGLNNYKNTGSFSGSKS